MNFQKSENFVQGIASRGAFIFRHSVKFSELGPTTPSLLQWRGVKFGAKNFTSNGAMCHPCGAKNLQIASWVI